MSLSLERQKLQLNDKERTIGTLQRNVNQLEARCVENSVAPPEPVYSQQVFKAKMIKKF